MNSQSYLLVGREPLDILLGSETEHLLLVAVEAWKSRNSTLEKLYELPKITILI